MVPRYLVDELRKEVLQRNLDDAHDEGEELRLSPDSSVVTGACTRCKVT